MGSSRRPRVFDPLDLEIIDHVYEAAWARVEANNFTRDTSRDDARKMALRQWIFALADSHPVDFDTLLDKLEKSIPEALAMPSRKKSRGGSPHKSARDCGPHVASNAKLSPSYTMAKSAHAKTSSSQKPLVRKKVPQD